MERSDGSCDHRNCGLRDPHRSERLLVADLNRLCVEADRHLIPMGAPATGERALHSIRQRHLRVSRHDRRRACALGRQRRHSHLEYSQPCGRGADDPPDHLSPLQRPACRRELRPRHGRVTEHGSFDDLMRHDGGGPENFRRMPLMQSEQYRLDGCTLPAQNRQQGESAAKLGEAH